MTTTTPPPITVTPDPAVTPAAAMDAVRARAAEYAESQRVRDERLDALREAIVVVDRARRDHPESGITRNDIIAAAGIGRQTVYDALNAAKA